MEAAGPAPARGLVAVGASAGGIEALGRLMRDLPEDLQAAVCVVVHIPATSRSLLAEIVSRQTRLPAVQAVDGARLADGHVYVAPPDFHLRVRGGRIELDRGPKENGVRPAIDALFRSAAAYGEQAIAVVLSGSLTDGASGAAAVAAAGGTVLVQHPGDAVVPSMPEAALAAVPAAVSLAAADLTEEIARRAASFLTPAPEEVPVTPDDLVAAESRRTPEGPPVALTCPECHGPLWELREGELVRYRCRVGHAFYEDVLLNGKGAAIETALWMALEALEERAELLYKVADRLEGGGRAALVADYRERARVVGERAELVRGVLIVDEEPLEPAR